MRGKLFMGAGILAIEIVLFSWSLAGSETQAAPTLEKLSKSERLEKVSETVQELKGMGDKESRVLVSFDEFKGTDFVKDLAKDKTFKVEQMYHAHMGKNNTFGGGYILAEGEDLEVAIENLETRMREDTKIILDGAEERLKNMYGKLKNIDQDTEKGAAFAKAVKGMEGTTQDLRDRMKAIEEKGAQVYGFRVKGKGKELAGLSENANIHAIEHITRVEDEKAMPLLPTKNNN